MTYYVNPVAFLLVFKRNINHMLTGVAECCWDSLQFGANDVKNDVRFSA